MSGLISRVNFGSPTPARNCPTSSQKVLVLRVTRCQEPGLRSTRSDWSGEICVLIVPELVLSQTEDVIQEDRVRQLGLS